MYNFSLDKIQIGISACLLGQKVRYDGGHKRSRFCTDVLAQHVEYVPLCPEIAIGLGTPRPTLRLVQGEGQIIAKTEKGQDVTQALTDYGKKKGQELDYVSGYIFCAKSPSCGMERVKLYNSEETGATREAVGLYAAELMKARPHLPVEENGRLNDVNLRENFITRVYAYHDWQSINRQGLTAKSLLAFHRRYKYLLLAHHPVAYRELGRLLADLSSDFQRVANDYIAGFMAALSKHASRKNNSNVLAHMQGYFKRKLTTEQRQELAHVIEEYRIGHLPLLAPITLLNHYLAQHPTPYIAQQRYLAPYPAEMKLRYAL